MADLESKVLEYIEPVFRFCLKRLADKGDAGDLSQEILTHVLDGIKKYTIKNMDSWVWQVASNRYARFINSIVKEAEVEFRDEYTFSKQSDYNMVEEMVIREEHQSIFAALHTLSAMYRDIIVDYYVDSISVAEIANKYGIPQTTVKWRLHSGREQIKERTDNMGKVYNRINWETTTCNGNMDSKGIFILKLPVPYV